MGKTCIYECELHDGQYIKTQSLQELSDFCNRGLGTNTYNKNMFHNYFSRKNHPNTIKRLERTDRREYYRDILIKEYGEEYMNNRTSQSINRRMRNLWKCEVKEYNELKEKNYYGEINNDNYMNEMVDMECEAQDDMEMWNGE